MDTPVITRKEAELQRLTRYYTGRECKRGHLSLRRTSDSTCIECVRILAQRPEKKREALERSAQWYKDNRELAAIRGKKHRERNALLISQMGANYRRDNRARITEGQAKYRAEKREWLRAKGRRAYSILGGVRWVKISTLAALKRSKAVGVPFDREAVMKCLSNPPSHCPIFGTKFEIGSGSAMQSDVSPTLDRVIPELGYVRGNLAIISWRANRLKSDANAEELRRIAEWLDAISSRLSSVA